MGGGHAHLCDEHAHKLKPDAKAISMERIHG